MVEDLPPSGSKENPALEIQSVSEVEASRTREREASVIQYRKLYERRMEKVLSFDFRSVGYGENGIENYDRFLSEFGRMVREAGDDPEAFLSLLASRGIGVIRNSRLLKTRQSVEQFLGLQIGFVQPDTVTAAFTTHEGIETILSGLRSRGKLDSFLNAELDSALSYPAVIFLAKHPAPKSIFHEGGHAIQFLSGLPMDAPPDSPERICREMEVNKAFIELKNEGSLGAVDRGVPKGFLNWGFGIVPQWGQNDVLREVDYFLSNLKKLEELRGNQDEVS